MARENTSRRQDSIVRTTEHASGIEVTCPRCERRWAVDEPAESSCPDCGASFSIRLREEFALIEHGGWAVAVSTAPDGRSVRGDG